MITTKKEKRILNSRGAQNFMDNLMNNTEEIGMKLNREKTQLLCVNTAINYDIRSSIAKDNVPIESGVWVQRLINLEIPVLVRSLKSSNVELG